MAKERTALPATESKPQSPTIGTAMAAYLESLPKEMANAYKRGLLYFVDFSTLINVISADQVTQEHLEEFGDSLREKGHKPKAVAARLAPVKGLIEFLASLNPDTPKPGLIESIPATKQDKSTSLEPNDIRKLVTTLINKIESAQGLKSKIRPCRDALLILLALFTGAEIEAIAGLRFSDFEGGENTTVTFQENGQRDRVTIPEPIFKLVTLLSRALDADKNQYIFTDTRTINNAPLSKDTLLLRVGNLTRKILGSPVSIQTLRNTYEKRLDKKKSEGKHYGSKVRSKILN